VPEGNPYSSALNVAVERSQTSPPICRPAITDLIG